jgi:DHA1 family multidrug resistance protein-like MFS transporter
MKSFPHPIHPRPPAASSGGSAYRQVILFLIMFVNMVGFGIIMPILPFFAEQMGANATHLGLLFSVYSVMQFFFAPMWGRFSDRVGRKPVIVVGLAGFSLSFFLFGLSTQLWMLYLARILGGALSSAALPTVMAYVADTTTESQRGGAMGRISAAMGLGITFGPVLGGFLGEVGPAFPFFFAAVTGALVCLFAAFFLPESLTELSRAAAKTRPATKQGMRGMAQALAGPIGFVMVLAFLSNFASSNLQGTFALYSESQIGAGRSELGVLFGAMGIAMAAAQGFLIGPMIRRWGEQRTIQLGLFCNGAGYVGFLFANSLWTMLPNMLLMGLGFAAMMPSVNSFVSKRGDSEQQGLNMGIVNAFSSLGRVFGPIAGGLIFDLIGPQWPYAFGALIFFSALTFAYVQFRRDARVRQQRVSVSVG